jgi:hypothetical protein
MLLQKLNYKEYVQFLNRSYLYNTVCFPNIVQPVQKLNIFLKYPSLFSVNPGLNFKNTP